MNISKKTILFLSIISFAQIIFAQNIPSKVIIRGKITDSQTGETLLGASVLAKGTTIGAITDDQGKYSISLEKGSYTLIFHFIGYEKQEIAIEANAAKTLDVKLVSNAIEIREVTI